MVARESSYVGAFLKNIKQVYAVVSLFSNTSRSWHLYITDYSFLYGA